MSSTTNQVAETDVEHGRRGSIMFVEYIEPKRVKVLPPAKYKLWLCVFVLVYSANWVSLKAGFPAFLRFEGWLSPEGAQFLYLCIVVFVLVYAGLDLMVMCLTIQFRGQTLGLGPWLKAERSHFAVRSNPKNFIAQAVGGVVSILEDGFGMFDAQVPDKTAQRVKTERGIRRDVSSVSTLPDDYDDESLHEYLAPARTFEGDVNSSEIVLQIEHRIRPSRKKDYIKWEDKIANAVQHFPGIISCEKTGFTREELTQEEGQEEQETVGCLQQVFIAFENIEFLNEWMISPERKALIKELRPMLARPDIVKIQADRVLPDAFTDLVTSQGQASPQLQPKKWKVWWLTTIALFMTIRWTNSFLPYYINLWDLDTAHPRLRDLVTLSVSTFLNAYVLTPLMLFLFSPWLHRHPHEVDTIEPWRTFNDGIGSTWAKAAVTIGFYGGCVSTWIVKSQTR